MSAATTAELPAIRIRGKFFHAGEDKWFVQGATYGPFPPGDDGVQLPRPEVVARDFAQMRDLGINLVRVYHPPPRWLLDHAADHGLRVLAAQPWAQHAEAMRSASQRREIERSLRRAVASCAGHPAMFGWMVGTEIATNVVRWMGAKKVRAFLDRLIDAVHEEDPRALASYASFPPTEYLIPAHADFITFNVFLERRENYRRYLTRLHHLAESRPLVIGEFGLDTLRHGEQKQAETLTWQHQETVASGGAGTILFSWTDEWFNGGQIVDDWKFGLVTAERKPKAACGALRPLLTAHFSPADRVPLPRVPRVSVIVCAYQAAWTIRGCLRTLDALRYPDYEIVLVDDGSTDATSKLVAGWLEDRPAGAVPCRHVVHTKNLGLSAARNTGAQAATGEILAYTDADCEPEPDWLYHLVQTLLDGEFAGVGGPNVPPPATSSIAAAVAASPGGPAHVLLTDTIAEHIPGCNMAFWRWAFDLAGGFDVQFRRAGDDVDFCWRVQANGGVIAFSPGAVVWHHRRFTMRAFWRQQSGYGEAEALLRFKHPIFFTALGATKWRGVIYGGPRLAWLFSRPMIYHGALGQGLFQSLYPPPIPLLAAYLGSFEWLLLTWFATLVCLPFGWCLVLPALMFLGSVAVALSWMAAAHLEPRYDHPRTRLAVAWMAWWQPVARGWARWWRRLDLAPAIPEDEATLPDAPRTLNFWSETGVGREILLAQLFQLLTTRGWRYQTDPGWRDWDLRVRTRYWDATISTVTDDHGRGKCLTRVQACLRPNRFTFFLLFLALCGAMYLALAFYPAFDRVIPRWASPEKFVWVPMGVFFVLLSYYFILRRRLPRVIAQSAKDAGLTPIP